METTTSISAEKASADRFKFDQYEGYGIKEQVMVKIDERHDYIKWLLQWDKKPRPPLPNLPEELREAMEAIRAKRDKNLADFRRDGHAYVQVDIFNDDDPGANLPDDHYEVIDD